MPQCFFHDDLGRQCHNQAYSASLYCSDHSDSDLDHDAKLNHLIAYAVGNSAAKKKDFWDKVSSSGTLISGLMVGLIGIIATNTYNERQLERQAADQAENLQIRRVEIVQKFFPHLVAESEGEQKGALLAIASLGDEKLATDLARNFEGAAATDALRQLAESSNPDIAVQAGAALDQRILSEQLSKSSPLVFVSHPDGALVATGALISEDGHILTAEHIVRGARDVWVSFNDNWDSNSEVPTDAQPVEIVATNRELDVALIKLVEPWDALPKPFAMSQKIPPLGADLLAAGYRGGLEVKLITKGQLISLDGPNGTWYGSMQAGRGASGGPVIDGQGQLVGYLVAIRNTGSQTVTVIRPISTLRQFLSAALAN